MHWTTALTPRRVRLVTGWILFGFVLSHFLNHALGLISIEAMEAGRWWFNLVWGDPHGTLLFYGALSIHFSLALQTLYHRRTLRMPGREALQLGLGLGLPLLLIPHIVGIRYGPIATGHYLDYGWVVQNLWNNGFSGVRQAVALVVAWVHGCLGLWFWLRPRDAFARFAPLFYAGALLVPVLALLGFTSAGKDVADGLYKVTTYPASAEGVRRAAEASDALYAACIGAILVVLLARALTRHRGLQHGFRVTYPDGRVVAVPSGSSVLEASRIGLIPHLAVCGGKGRCSTCRVRVVSGLSRQPSAGAEERATLDRIRAPDDVRLACQLRPVSDVAVAQVLSAADLQTLGATYELRSAGSERRIAVLFCDIRGFTRMTERRLPYDTVFLLNRYFAAVGEAIESSGGYIDKFIGDGAMALFGLGKPQDEACADALLAAARIARAVEALDRSLSRELDGQRLRIAMGLHTGPAIVGRMGYGRAVNLTVVGDTINTASRLEGVAKLHDADLVMSLDLARRGGLAETAGERREVEIRGRAAPLDVVIAADARRLDDLVGRAEAV